MNFLRLPDFLTRPIVGLGINQDRGIPPRRRPMKRTTGFDRTLKPGEDWGTYRVEDDAASEAKASASYDPTLGPTPPGEPLLEPLVKGYREDATAVAARRFAKNRRTKGRLKWELRALLVCVVGMGLFFVGSIFFGTIYIYYTQAMKLAPMIK